MSKQFFLPESLCEVDSNMDLRKIAILYANHSTVIGKVTRINPQNQSFTVNLGGNLNATMRFEDSTIYPIYKTDNILSPNITTLVGKIIQAKIAYFDDNDIYLSRKENMLEALEELKFETENIFAVITGFSRMSAFLDIGSGIVGRCYGKHFSNVVFNTVQDIGIKKNELISVKIINFLENSNLFELSRVDTLPDSQNILCKNDTVNCKVFNSLGDGVGYHVLIDATFAGIVDSRKVKLKYGDNITALIKRISPRGPKLHFIEKL